MRNTFGWFIIFLYFIGMCSFIATEQQKANAESKILIPNGVGGEHVFSGATTIKTPIFSSINIACGKNGQANLNFHTQKVVYTGDCKPTAAAENFYRLVFKARQHDCEKD